MQAKIISGSIFRPHRKTNSIIESKSACGIEVIQSYYSIIHMYVLVHIYVYTRADTGGNRRQSPPEPFQEGDCPPLNFAPPPSSLGGEGKKLPPAEHLGGGEILINCQIILKIPYLRLNITKNQSCPRICPPPSKILYPPLYIYFIYVEEI